MIDPLVSLAFSMQSSKGVYALLLGSGVSRAAGIPTGWEIVLDLIRRLASVLGEDCEHAPDRWYADKFGKEPDYSELLEELAKTTDERRNLLHAYFEPTPEEREEGKKTPSQAHRAIADLVARGFIKVIVTTNFDRLMEQALADAGVQPTVISTPDALNGAAPLVHSACTVIKVHGDYMDTRVKNSPAELADYAPALNAYLDRVFDEFGLIVCGWSAEWDTALRAAIERAPNRRYSIYWFARSEPQGQAKRLCDLRKAEVVINPGADQVFLELREKVLALEEVNRQHPLSVKVAVARLKKYLSAGNVIAAHDMVMEETERVVGELSAPDFDFNTPVSGQELARRLAKYESHTELLQALMAHGCYWGDERFRTIWPACVQRLANARERSGGKVIWLDLIRYPAMLLFYAGGIGAIAGKNYKNLVALLYEVKIKDGSKEFSAAELLNHMSVIRHDFQKAIPGKEQHDTPLPNHVYESLHEVMRPLVPEDAGFTKSFHLFEIYVGLVYGEAELFSPDPMSGKFWAPPGRYCWDHHGYPYPSFADSILWAEQERLGAEWPPLKAGMFGGDVERFKTVKEQLVEFLQRVRSQSAWY